MADKEQYIDTINSMHGLRHMTSLCQYQHGWQIIMNVDTVGSGIPCTVLAVFKLYSLNYVTCEITERATVFCNGLALLISVDDGFE